MNSLAIIGCELLSVVGDVVSDVTFVSIAPVNGLVSDLTTTGVVLILPSTECARNCNTIIKYNRQQAMIQAYILHKRQKFNITPTTTKSHGIDVSDVNSACSGAQLCLSDTCRYICVDSRLVSTLPLPCCRCRCARERNCWKRLSVSVMYVCVCVLFIITEIV